MTEGDQVQEALGSGEDYIQRRVPPHPEGPKTLSGSHQEVQGYWTFCIPFY